jgi:dTDP-4-amino-4,6-dideoxygalactose transaminase
VSNTPVTGKLAIDGGKPVRTEPLPWELPGAHWFGQEEIDLVTKVLQAKSPFRFYGPDKLGYTEQFEEAWRARHGRRHALGVNSGTAALHICLSAFGVGPGDEVIVPGYMWVSCISAIVRTGAIPRLADIDDTWCMDPNHLESLINERTKAVLVVNMSGAPGHIKDIAEICRKHKIYLLEDCAQASGSTLHGAPVGSFGDASIFSFQLNKNLSAGEGGAILTDNEKIFKRCVALHDLGYPRVDGRLDTTDPQCALWGVGSRMSELTAAVLLAQNKKLDQITGAMRTAKWQIRERLSGIKGLEFRNILDPKGDSGPFLISLFESAEKATRFMAALKAEGISGPKDSLVCLAMKDFGLHWYYNVLSLTARTSNSADGFPWSHPANSFAQDISYARGTLPRCDDYSQRAGLLTVASCLSQQDIDDIVTAYKKVAAEILES